MIAIKDASNQACNVIDRHKSNLESRYEKVEYSCSDQGLSLTCSSGTGKSITLRLIPDHERRSINAPKSGRDYQNQGGHMGLIEKFKHHNPEAWKIEVKTSTGEAFYETAFSGNESNWDVDAFEKEMLGIFDK